jgi:hypothetical protein
MRKLQDHTASEGWGLLRVLLLRVGEVSAYTVPWLLWIASGCSVSQLQPQRLRRKLHQYRHHHAAVKFPYDYLSRKKDASSIDTHVCLALVAVILVTPALMSEQPDATISSLVCDFVESVGGSHGRISGL